MLDVIGINGLFGASRHEDLDCLMRIPNGPVIKRKLDALIGQLLANLERLTKIRKFRLPAIERSDVYAKLFSDFKVRCAIDTKIRRFLTELWSIFARPADRAASFRIHVSASQPAQDAAQGSRAAIGDVSH